MKIDYNHSQWNAVTERLNQTLETLKDELTRPNDHSKTTDLRGRVAMIKGILNWPEQDKPNQKVEGPYDI